MGADDFGEPIPDTGATMPEDYGGSGPMNPENPGTGGSGDILQDDAIQDDTTAPMGDEGGSGLQDDQAAGGSGMMEDDLGTGGAGTTATDPGTAAGTGTTGTPDTGTAQTQDKDTKAKDKAKSKAKDKAKSGAEGTGGSGLEDDQRFEGDSFPSDNERVNEPAATPPAGAPVPTP
jgi:hypothetical protein